jgi:hypothetical protein
LVDRTVITSSADIISDVPEICQSISGDGEYVSGSSKLYWAETGFPVSSLPKAYALVTFSSDDRYLLAWDEFERETVSIPLDSLLDPIIPAPRPGKRLNEAPESLTWTGVPGAVVYRVYLGTNEDEVTSASGPSPGSTVFLGDSSGTSFTLTSPLTLGNRYFWRVDTVRSDGVTKGTTHFFDVPFQPADAPIELPDGIAGEVEEIGKNFEVSSDGLWLSGANRVFLFDFDFETGASSYRQVINNNPSENGLDGVLGDAMAAAPGLLITGDQNGTFPFSYAGEVAFFSPLQSGRWGRQGVLSRAGKMDLRNAGNQLSFDSNQLLVRYGDGNSGDGTRPPGKVFSYFQWPEWTSAPRFNPVTRSSTCPLAVSIRIGVLLPYWRMARQTVWPRKLFSVKRFKDFSEGLG